MRYVSLSLGTRALDRFCLAAFVQSIGFRATAERQMRLESVRDHPLRIVTLAAAQRNRVPETCCRNLVLTAVFAFLLGGCGGGGGGEGGGSAGVGSDSPVPISVISGVALDGYLSAAVVFYDLNENGVLDSGEPSGITNGSGQYSLTVNQSDLGKHKVMLNAIAGQTVDSDSAGTPISTGYTLATTKDHPEIVSPLTTKIVAAITSDSRLSSTQAEGLVKSTLGLSGTSQSLFQDFANESNQAANPDLIKLANQAKVIRVTLQAALAANPKANPLDLIKLAADSIRTRIGSGQLDLTKINVSTMIDDTTAKSLVASASGATANAPGSGASAAASSSGSNSRSIATSTATPVVPQLSVQSSPTTSTHAGVFYAEPIVVKVVDQHGQPIAGVTPTVSANDNGWVIGNQPTSNAGLATYYWAPGSSASPAATITYAGSSKIVTGTTTPWPTHPNGLANAAFSTNPGSATGYQRDVTPQSDPAATYYAALNWNQGYAGMQVSADGIHQLIFSAWDIFGYNKVQIINAVGSTCQTFGDEGTGSNCIIAYPWVIGHTYRFIMTMAPSNDGTYTDITCTFADLSTGTVVTIGTLRQYGTPTQTSVASFAEDLFLNHLDCFSVPNRVVTYGVPSYLSGGAWNKMPSLEYGNWTPTQYCAVNTYQAADDGSITLYMGGSYQAQSTSSLITIH